MTNQDLFLKDPLNNNLLNQGVAKVTSGRSEQELNTLTYELTNFVCDGQYADGLARVLGSYLDHLDKNEQPGVWVSGFFGSGKSHLVKMLQHLWVDTPFANGSTARGLARVPERVAELLKELSTNARRAGGLHAAAGMLGTSGTGSVRLDLLAVVFQSVGLPSVYRTACFQLWLREKGIEQAVLAAIAAAGLDREVELANFFLSDVIATAILAQSPGSYNSVGDVKLLLESQIQEKQDVSLDEMVTRIKQAVGTRGKLPLTLIVLDEVQQYIGEDISRSKGVQDLQEQCCARLSSNLLFVATGQNALSSGHQQLERLLGRFPVTIQLQDTDVEQVTREVVLKKKPTAEPALQAALANCEGEIARHLSGTKIGPIPRDRNFLITDYPILPVRRRFWERVLRAVDKTGTGAQLRTQLWIVFDAVKRTAELPLGNVVSGAFLFEYVKTRVLQQGVLLQEMSENIARQLKEDDGPLRYQLAALVYLIGQLPREGPNDTGMRADADTLADLLVTDLTAGSAALRKQVPVLLDKLVADGVAMRIDDEYRMQTREGAEWDRGFTHVKNELLGNLGKLGTQRRELIRNACQATLERLKLPHGLSKATRKIELGFGDSAPQPKGGEIPVWVRDGWEAEAKTVTADALTAGENTPAVFVFVARKDTEKLAEAIANHYAAEATLAARGSPHTPEGAEARRAMETRRDQALRDRDRAITEMINDATVLVAGGEEKAGALLAEKVEAAARACFPRLFIRFDAADSADWHKVTDRAKKDPDALSAVGYKGDPDKHPVCKAVADCVGSGKRGTEVRNFFREPPYGWPQDAVDAALTVLFQAGILTAKSGSEPVAKGKLDLKTIPAAEFRVENITLSNKQLTELRGLFKKLGFNTPSGQESTEAAKFVNQLIDLARSAGGPTPVPPSPDTAHLSDLINRAGNDQLKALHDARDRLTADVAEWQKRRDLIAKRRPLWDKLKALSQYAEELPVAAEVAPEVAAVEKTRSLLADTDHVPGLVDKLATALRDALNAAHAAAVARHEAGLSGLEENTVWQKLTPEQKFDCLTGANARTVPPIAVGTTDDILATLRGTNPRALQDLADAMPTRFANALAAAAKLLEPQAQRVTLPQATIKTEEELAAWLTAAGDRIRAKLKDGPVIL
jgi:hypothetical protein